MSWPAVIRAENLVSPTAIRTKPRKFECTQPGEGNGALWWSGRDYIAGRHAAPSAQPDFCVHKGYGIFGRVCTQTYGAPRGTGRGGLIAGTKAGRAP